MLRTLVLKGSTAQALKSNLKAVTGSIYSLFTRTIPAEFSEKSTKEQIEAELIIRFHHQLVSQCKAFNMNDKGLTCGGADATAEQLYPNVSQKDPAFFGVHEKFYVGPISSAQGSPQSRPFSCAIKLFRDAFTQMKCPVLKAKQLLNVFKSVTQQVYSLWVPEVEEGPSPTINSAEATPNENTTENTTSSNANTGEAEDLSPKPPVITGDDVAMILQYVIASAAVQSLFTELFIIKEFSNSSGEEEYYLTATCVAAAQLIHGSRH